MKQIQVGIIGYGKGAGIFHIPFIQTLPEFRIKKIVHRSADKSSIDYPVEEVEKDPESIFQDKDIDLVIITTPNDTHYEYAKKALESGKHVVVEKPFTTQSNHAQELIDLAKTKNRIISVYQNRRWDSDFLTVKKIIEDGYLGRLVEYESHFDRFRNYIRPNSWKEQKVEGSGILYDLSPHLIDQALILFGPPRAVTADIIIQREGGQADDHFELIFLYDRLRVILKAGMLVRKPNHRFILHGTEGSFVKDGFDPQEKALNEGFMPDDPNWGAENEVHWGTIDTTMRGLHLVGKIESIPGSYQSYYKNLADAILHGAELSVKPEEAMNVIKMIEVAMLSNDLKRTLEVNL